MGCPPSDFRRAHDSHCNSQVFCQHGWMDSATPATIPRILPVILAGGIGARLAPISTDARPKPFLPLPHGDSLLTQTLRRVADATHFLPPVLIGRAADRFALLNHAREAGVLPQAILLEAAPRNTGLACALAAAWAEIHVPPDTLVAILPADHAIATPELWQRSIYLAAQASRISERLCLLGAEAKHANSDFGYILCGPAGTFPWRTVEQFLEKPEDPQEAIDRGAFWNMGQFMASAALLSALFRTHAPAFLSTACAWLAQAESSFEFIPIAPWPEHLPAQPFDRLIVEQASCLAVAYAGEWQDLGSLAAWVNATGLTIEDYAQLSPRIDRPWGYFELLDAWPDRLRKRLVIYPGCRLSRQRHRYRSEHWLVREGMALVEKDAEIHQLSPGKSITIPRDCWHRLSNLSQNILIIEETQDGEPDETDIERAEDDYGRL